jgi:hypothetical protein
MSTVSISCSVYLPFRAHEHCRVVSGPPVHPAPSSAPLDPFPTSEYEETPSSPSLYPSSVAPSDGSGLDFDIAPACEDALESEGSRIRKPTWRLIASREDTLTGRPGHLEEHHVLLPTAGPSRCVRLYPSETFGQSRTSSAFGESIHGGQCGSQILIKMQQSLFLMPIRSHRRRKSTGNFSISSGHTPMSPPFSLDCNFGGRVCIRRLGIERTCRHFL